MKAISRRRFICATTAAVFVPTLIPARLLGADAPSKKITIGFSGTGDHGTGWNLRRYMQLPDARVLVVCDVDADRMQKAKQIVDEHYLTYGSQPRRSTSMSGPDRYGVSAPYWRRNCPIGGPRFAL